jgi:translocation and assembly module TamB
VLGAVLLLVVLPLALLAGILGFANSEAGRGMIARLVAAGVPGLTIEGLDGPLPGRIAASRIAMADEAGVWLEVADARLTLDLRALLGRRLHLEALEAARITLHRLPVATDGPPAEPGPLIPDLPSLPLSVQLDRLRVAEIVLAEGVLGEAFTLALEGEARLEPWGLTARIGAGSPDGATTLSLDASLRPGTGRLAARIGLVDRAMGPVARLAGVPGPVRLDLDLDGPAEEAAFRLVGSAGDGIAAALSGVVRAPESDRLGLTAEGAVTGGALLPAPFDGPLAVAVDAGQMPDGALDVRRLRVSGAPATLTARGRIAPDGALALRVQGEVAGSAAFAPLLDAVPLAWEGLAVSSTINGLPASAEITLEVQAQGLSSPFAQLGPLLGPTPRLTFRGTLPDRIAALRVDGAGVTVEAHGGVGAMLDLAFNADLTAPDAAVPGLAGALRLAGTATGARENPTLALTAESARLALDGRVLEDFALTARVATPLTAPRLDAEARGRFGGQPVAVDLRGSPAEDGWLLLEAGRAAFGDATLTAEGRIHPERQVFDGTLRLAMPDLAPLASLAGQAASGALTLDAALTPRGSVQTGRVTLGVPRAQAAGVAIRDLRATLSGSLAALEIEAAGTIAEVQAALAATLAQQGEARLLTVPRLTLAGFGETARLATPARITLRPDGGVQLAPLTLATGRGPALRAEGVWGPERADLRVTLPAFALATLGDVLPGPEPAGSLTATLRVTGPTSAPELALEARGTGVRIGPPGLATSDVRVEARRAASGAITANAQLAGGRGARANATLALPQGPAGPLQGSLRGRADLAPLTSPFLAAGADRVTGELVLALDLGGTIAAPETRGEMRLSGGSWRNTLYGVALTALAGTVRADGGPWRVDLAGRAGAGRLALTGTVDPLAPGMLVDVALRAENAAPVSLDLLRTSLDAELRLAGGLGSGATLSGPIRLRRTEIRIPERLPAGVRRLTGVTEIGSPPGRPPVLAPAAPRRGAPPPPADAPPILLDLQVAAPRGVFVRGRGLDAEMGGTVAVTGSLAAPSVTGELALIRGDVSILARRLAFDRGRLAFDGGLVPSLDFRASSLTGGTTVSVEVSGSPTEPEIRFTSSPDLPQDEVLARLLFDRPTGQLSPFEIAQIAQALAGASGIAGGGATGILDRVRQTLALDRLAVGGGGEGAARTTAEEERRGPTLEAGRYIADGVYVGVRQGTEAGSSRVGVRVELTPRIRLEAETGDREAGERVGITWEYQWGR